MALTIERRFQQDNATSAVVKTCNGDDLRHLGGFQKHHD